MPMMPASTPAKRFAITGGGAGIYRSSDRWKWVLGATYVNRASTQILPVAGFIYTPNDDSEYNLVFPVPKIAWRLPWSDTSGHGRTLVLPRRRIRRRRVGRPARGRHERPARHHGLAHFPRPGTADRRRPLAARRTRIRLQPEAGVSEQSADEIELGDTLMVRGGLTY